MNVDWSHLQAVVVLLSCVKVISYNSGHQTSLCLHQVAPLDSLKDALSVEISRGKDSDIFEYLSFSVNLKKSGNSL